VRLEEPHWWYGETPDPRQRLLAPIGQLYGWLAERRFRRRQPYRSRYPVICIGNFTMGGTGKTPLALFIAELLLARGEKPVFLTRGYGGKSPGPVWVEDTPDAARRFGDEPLLLARIAPTLVARDRRAGALMIEDGTLPVSAIIMDDGLQNPALKKDLTIAVVDGQRGVGNGEVFPAGPLRAPLEFQLGLIDAIVVRAPVSTPAREHAVHALLRREFPGPVLAAHVVARGDTAWLNDAPIVAFAGIANPDRFFALLENLGANIVERLTFPDHHTFTPADCDQLLASAQAKDARLATTEKDWMRLKGDAAVPTEMLERTQSLAIETVFEARDLGRITSLIETVTQRQGYPRQSSRPPQI